METPHAGAATAVCLGLRSGPPPRKNRSSALVLTMPAAADVIRAIVEQSRRQRAARYVSGESWPPPMAPLPSSFTTVACRGANSRSAPGTPPSLRGGAAAHRASLGTATVRGVIGEEVNRVWRRCERRRPRFGAGVRASWLLERFLAVRRVIQGDDVIGSTFAGRPDFPRRRTGAGPRLAR